MGKCIIPPLSQFELEQAANAAAAIVTRCSMLPEHGFVNAETLFDTIRRPSTRGSVTFDLKAVEVVLAHPYIRARLIERGFKFERSQSSKDIFYHRGCEYRMQRFGSTISGRALPPAGSEDERLQVDEMRNVILSMYHNYSTPGHTANSSSSGSSSSSSSSRSSRETTAATDDHDGGDDCAADIMARHLHSQAGVPYAEMPDMLVGILQALLDHVTPEVQNNDPEGCTCMCDYLIEYHLSEGDVQ
jgi:hypothetical protein